MIRHKSLFKTIFNIAFAIALHSGAQAQTIITGKVVDGEGKAVDAYLTVTEKGKSSILSFADTDGKGRYKLEFKTPADSIIVTVDGLEISQQVKTVPNRTQQLDFQTEQKVIELEEVNVRARKISQNGDTLNYLVGAYRQQIDRTIGDVLKRMPGIEVTDNGGIRFNGKSISKFYVEDMDLLQGRYGLATNNVNAQDVATVQVLQNHQPVKTLQGNTLSDDIAINLKLKDSAKGTVAVNAMASIGVQQVGGCGFGTRPLSDGMTVIGRNPLWMAEIVGMYFSRRRQNITLYKGNNTGDNVANELTVHGSAVNSVGLYPYCPMGAVMPSENGLPRKRSFDNHSNIMTINQLEKLNNDTEITMNVAFYNDRVRQEGTSGADYFINDGQRLVSSETLTSLTNVNNLNAELRFCRNAKNNFLANVVKFEGGWDSDDVAGDVASSLKGINPVDYGLNHVNQTFHRPSLSVSNTLNTIRNYGKHKIDLHFSAGYAQRPNTLTVGIDSLLQGTSAHYVQNLISRHTAGNFHTNYTFNLSPFSLNYGVLANASLHRIFTDLYGFKPTNEGASTENDLRYNVYELTLSQYYKFEKMGWRLSLGCPLNIYTLTLDDRIRRNRQTHTRLLVSPTLSAGYERLDWSGSINGSYYRNVGDPGGIYSGYIMTNYRSFQRSYMEQISESDRISAGATLAYRSALNATFFSLSANYNHAAHNQIYGYDYYGATSVVYAIDQKTTSDSYGFGVDSSKGLDWWQTTVRAFGGYNYSRSERLIDRKLYPFHSRTVSIGAGATVTPMPWVNIVVSTGYAWSVSETDKDAGDMAYTIRTATQRIKLNFYLTKRLSISASAEDNYNNLTEENRHAWFGDIAAKYKLKRIDLELQANNIFNQTRYTRVNYHGLDIYTSTSQLRPLNIIASIRFKLL